MPKGIRKIMQETAQSIAKISSVLAHFTKQQCFQNVIKKRFFLHRLIAQMYTFANIPFSKNPKIFRVYFLLRIEIDL